MKSEKILRVNRSWKFDGYLMVVSSNGKQYKRKFRENSKGRFSGKVVFNCWDNVYSFENVSGWSEVQGDKITFEGRYVDLYKTKDSKPEEQVEIKLPEVPEEQTGKAVDFDKEVKHSKYETIKCCVENNIPVYLVGPAGSGKNHTLEQIAKEMGMEFYFTNSVQQEYKLTGFIDAGGQYHETEFYKAFVNGGLFFLDEMDASIPEVLVLLNAAIANGYFEFPNGKVTANENFRVVAAGNTMGNGADEQYVGRLTLDQATLDRFAIIEFGYDLMIELSISKGNAELVNFIHQLREEAESKGIRATFSYRCISMVTKLEQSGMKLETVIAIAVMKGFDMDTIKTFNAIGFSKYHKALGNFQRAA